MTDIRRALRSAGVKLTTAARAADTQTCTVGPTLGQREEQDVGGKEGRDKVAPSAFGATGGRCMVVGKHGSLARCRGDGGDAVSGCSGGVPVYLREGVSRDEPSSSSSPPSSSASTSRPLPMLERDVRAALEAEARAETVSLLWIEACHRVGDFGPPSECEQVFRPQRWPIKTFSAVSSRRPSPPPHRDRNRRNTATDGSAPALALGGGGREERDIAGRGVGDGGRGCMGLRVTVTGFKGAERSGWEQLILGIGAEMCRNLSRHVTTHVVCKEVRFGVRAAALACRWTRTRVAVVLCFVFLWSCRRLLCCAVRERRESLGKCVFRTSAYVCGLPIYYLDVSSTLERW